MKAFLLAAGLGTRLKPFTDKHPKALVEINGQSLLERNIKFLQKSGISDVVVNVHHFADQIIQKVKESKGFGSHIIISDEPDALLETGGGLKKAAPFLTGSETVLMMNVDILCEFDLNKMLDDHQKSSALATLAVQNRNSSRQLLFDANNQLRGWRNNQTNTEKLPYPLADEHLEPFAFSGIQLLQQELLSKIKQVGKFSIIDTYLDLCTTEKILGWEHSDDLWLDVGKPESLEEARQVYHNK